MHISIKRVNNGFVTHDISDGGWESGSSEHVFQDTPNPDIPEEHKAFQDMIQSLFFEYFQTKRAGGFTLAYHPEGWSNENDSRRQ